MNSLATKKNIPIHTGAIEALGAMVGNDDRLIGNWLTAYVNKQQAFLDLLLRDDLSAQIVMLLLRLCVIPRMGYLTRVIAPRLLLPHLKAFDTAILTTATRKFRLPVNLPDEAKFTLSMPIRLGGFGLRPLSQLAPVAFWSSLAQSALDIVQCIPQERRTELLVTGSSQIPLARHLESSHTAILAHGLPSGDNGLPQSVEQFWAVYGAERPDRGLQSTIWGHHQSTAFDNVIQGSLTNLKVVQRLLSASSTNAGAWLSCIPSCPELTMPDTDFCYAARLRLGLPC